MGLPMGNIPWLRGVGAIGAVVSMVTGGAVTTAGAIDDPGGAETATVQLMATDADGTWFSCDVAVDTTGSGPAALSVTITGPGDGAPGGAMAVTGSAVLAAPEGEVPSPPPGAGTGFTTVVSGTIGAAEGAEGGLDEGGGAEAVPVPAESITVGELPPIPDPAAVRAGTGDECDGLDVTFGEAPLPGVPAVAPAGVTAVPADGND